MPKYRWTAITAYCYSRGMICKDCPELESCAMGERAEMSTHKEYGLRNVKEAVLSTYRHLGKKGLEKYIGDKLW